MMPSILDTAKDYLFADVSKMEAAGLPAVTQRHLIRLRDIYNYWLKFPLTKDRDLVAYIQQVYELQATQAYADLRLVKALLGDLQKSTKEYHRYRFIEMARLFHLTLVLFSNCLNK